MILAENKKALFDYEILEKMEAGLVLSGQEVKSAKNKTISLKGAFVTFHGNDALLTNAHFSAYPQAGPIPQYDPTRSRRLLLHKKQIAYLRGKSQEKGLTIVPLMVYIKNHLVKVEIAVARGRHKYDKREVLKERDLKKELSRAQKQKNF
ncbi:MAG: SsrA-binding protein SmpB [Patescibacteria group bacterium]